MIAKRSVTSYLPFRSAAPRRAWLGVLVALAPLCLGLGAASAQGYLLPAARPNATTAAPAGTVMPPSRCGKAVAPPLGSPLPTVVDRAPRAPSGGTLRFTSARLPRLEGTPSVGEPLSLAVEVTNTGKGRARGWLEASVCRLGTESCVQSATELRTPQGRPGVERGRPTKVTLALQPPGAGLFTVWVALYEGDSQLVDRWQGPMLELGRPDVSLVDFLGPSGGELSQQGASTPARAQLTAVLHNAGAADAAVQAGFVVSGGKAGDCLLELYSPVGNATAGGGRLELSAAWDSPAPGPYGVTVTLYDARGEVIAQRKGLRVWIP